jgi:hypothetical protein
MRVAVRKALSGRNAVCKFSYTAPATDFSLGIGTLLAQFGLAFSLRKNIEIRAGIGLGSYQF